MKLRASDLRKMTKEARTVNKVVESILDSCKLSAQGGEGRNTYYADGDVLYRGVSIDDIVKKLRSLGLDVTMRDQDVLDIVWDQETVEQRRAARAARQARRTAAGNTIVTSVNTETRTITLGGDTPPVITGANFIEPFDGDIPF